MTKRVLDSTRESAYKGVIAVSLTATLLSAVFLVTVLPMISEFAEMNIDSLKSDAIYCGVSLHPLDWFYFLYTLPSFRLLHQNFPRC
ncbi:unnamed protein product [Nippostrongylus brasiliensis]|uniref:Col_cuticle_N domain-containing protein n=1 Tax=Nippostrongylus brasiliensis TaxID=27835 RepID=A0A0N4YY45_NIPBR|nr:unnamed protein product [Nippostrongylus brasiliensis]